MQRTVTVVGHGVTPAVPDSAVVRVGASHQARTVADAVAGVDSAVSAIGRVTRGLVADAAVTTTGLRVWPAQDHEGRPVGFEASHQLRIGCPNLPVASVLVVGLAEEVGDRLRIEGVELEVSDRTAAMDSAREAAYRDARRRAAQLAALESLVLGELLSVVEDAGEAMQGPSGSLRAMTIEPGETLIGTSVRATWQLV